MNKLLETVPWRGRSKVGPCVGIELEFEGAGDRSTIWTRRNPTHWRITRDNSLRQGVEFVSQILTEETLPGALKIMKAVLKRHRLKNTSRCGTHVHVNITDLTLCEIWQFLTLYMLVEPYIFEQFAPERKNNHFCLPLTEDVVFLANFYDNIQMVRNHKNPFGCTAPTMGKDLGKRNLHNLTRTCAKYSALNVLTASNIGTFEFRHLHSTKDMDELRGWVDFCRGLREKAIRYKGPDEILDDYEESPIEFISECGLDFNKMENLSIEDIEQAEDAAYMIAGNETVDWEKLDWTMKEA